MTSIDLSLIVTILLWLASKIKEAFIWKNEMIGDNKSDVSLIYRQMRELSAMIIIASVSWL